MVGPFDMGESAFKTTSLMIVLSIHVMIIEQKLTPGTEVVNWGRHIWLSQLGGRCWPSGDGARRCAVQRVVPLSRESSGP